MSSLLKALAFTAIVTAFYNPWFNSLILSVKRLNLFSSLDKIKAYDLDEEIDFLHSIIERQEVLEMKQQTTRKQSKHPGKKNAAESYRSGNHTLFSI